MENPDPIKPGPPPEPIDKPKTPIKRQLRFSKNDQVSFQFWELIYQKAMYNEDGEIILQFAVDESFSVIIDQLEYFLYAQEIFDRSARTIQEEGEEYYDVCFPNSAYWSTIDNKAVYYVQDLINNIEELEDEEQIY